MAHHSDQANDEINKYMARKMMEAAKRMQGEANNLGLGPTGKFPEGKLVEHDEGEIQLAIANYQGKVIINFGSPVAFIGFTPEQAIEIAGVLVKHAKEILDQ